MLETSGYADGLLDLMKRLRFRREKADFRRRVAAHFERRGVIAATQIWNIDEGISVGATSDGQITCFRCGRNLNKGVI